MRANGLDRIAAARSVDATAPRGQSWAAKEASRQRFDDGGSAGLAQARTNMQQQVSLLPYRGFGFFAAPS